MELWKSMLASDRHEFAHDYVTSWNAMETRRSGEVYKCVYCCSYRKRGRINNYKITGFLLLLLCKLNTIYCNKRSLI